ncbi:MAG: hypothetical protein LBT30_00280 [Clostridiales bacterium]|jgi:hypothetical protein|nr:hypothetical protein [Clostridiales bacterium]
MVGKKEKAASNSHDAAIALSKKVSGLKGVFLSVVLVAVILTSAFALSLNLGQNGGAIDTAGSGTSYADPVMYFITPTVTTAPASSTGGYISPDGSPDGYVSVTSGTDRFFTITPASNFRVQNIIVDGTAIDSTQIAEVISNNGYTFYNVTANHTIKVMFAPTLATSFTITATAGANGNITPKGVVNVLAGQEQLYTFATNSGYRVLNIIVDGIALGSSTTPTLADAIANGYLMDNMIIDDRTIDVTFALTSATIYQIIASPTYPITGTLPSDSRIIPSGTINVVSGNDQTFYFEQNVNDQILNILVDGKALNVSEFADALANGYTFNNVNGNHTIEVAFAPVGATIYTITSTATPAAGGNITPLGSFRIATNGSQTFNFAANSGYKIQNIVVNGTALSGTSLTTAINNRYYTFNNVTGDRTIDIVFASLATHTITSTATSGGTITPLGAVSVDDDGSQVFDIIPTSGYRVLNIIVDGAALEGAALTAAINNNKYTFSNVTSNHTIDAEFAPTSATTYKIKSTTTAGGKVTPLGTISVVEGTSRTFDITWDEINYNILNIIVDGVALNESEWGDVAYYGGYTFSGVNGDHTIDVEFALRTATVYDILATSGSNGKIIPSGKIYVVSGTNRTFTFAANAGYQVDTIRVDGTLLSGSVLTNAISNGVAFLNVTSDRTIEVTFKAVSTTTYTLQSKVSGGKGTVSPSGSSSVLAGSNFTYTFAPITGYEVAKITIDGVAVNDNVLNDSINGNTYTFVNVSADHIIIVSFGTIKPKYTIIIYTNFNGTVSPGSLTSGTLNFGFLKVTEGLNITFTFAPDSGYRVKSITIDKIDEGTPPLSGTAPRKAVKEGYTFENVTGNHSIDVAFGRTNSWIDDADKAKDETDDGEIHDKLDKLIKEMEEILERDGADEEYQAILDDGDDEDGNDDYKDYLKEKLKELYDELTDKAGDKLDKELKKIYDEAIAAIDAAKSFTDATAAYEDGRTRLLAAANKKPTKLWLFSLLGFETTIGAGILVIKRKSLRHHY